MKKKIYKIGDKVKTISNHCIFKDKELFILKVFSNSQGSEPYYSVTDGQSTLSVFHSQIIKCDKYCIDNPLIWINGSSSISNWGSFLPIIDVKSAVTSIKKITTNILKEDLEVFEKNEEYEKCVEIRDELIRRSKLKKNAKQTTSER